MDVMRMLSVAGYMHGILIVRSSGYSYSVGTGLGKDGRGIILLVEESSH